MRFLYHEPGKYDPFCQNFVHSSSGHHHNIPKCKENQSKCKSDFTIPLLKDYDRKEKSAQTNNTIRSTKTSSKIFLASALLCIISDMQVS